MSRSVRGLIPALQTAPGALLTSPQARCSRPGARQPCSAQTSAGAAASSCTEFFFFYGLEEETLLSKYCPEGMMEFIYHGARFSLL